VAWSEKEIANFLDDGMNPAGDFAGGGMADVVANTSQLSADDRAAIAHYIASLPPVKGPTPPPPPPKKD
jgi:cytochrome c553